jgi:hypothetical protein
MSNAPRRMSFFMFNVEIETVQETPGVDRNRGRNAMHVPPGPWRSS